MIKVGREMGMGDKGVLIGMIAALTESDLYNYSNRKMWPTSVVLGDREPPPQYADSTKDSLGLFQQRPKWWGTGDPEQRVVELMTPERSARLFYEALKGDQGWQTLDPWMAAQRVQGSEYPDGSNYRDRIEQANRVINGGPTHFTDGGK